MLHALRIRFGKNSRRLGRWSLALALGILAALAGRASADETETGTELTLGDLLVITATLHEQGVLDAPAAISVVTADDIAARGYRSLSEILADTVGFNEVSDVNEEIIATRGVFASTTNKTLFLIDGHRMNDLLLGRYNVDQYLGLEAVERIELIRGPVGPLYGSGALVGVVNIITRRGRHIDGVRLKYQGGLHANEASFTWGKLVGDYDLSFNVTFRDQRGQSIPQPAEKDFADEAMTMQPRLPGKIYWRRYPENVSGIAEVRTEDSSFIVRGSHFRRVTPRGAKGSLYVYGQEALVPTFTENDLFFDYSRRWTFGANDANALTLNPSIHHFDYFEQSYLELGANRRPPYGTRSGTLAEMTNYQLKLTYDRTFLDSLSGTVGLDALLASIYRADRFNIEGAGADQRVILTPQGYAPTGRWWVTGVLSQALWSPIRPLTITAGARYDLFLYSDKISARPTPRLGLVFRPRDEVAFKVLYGESYLAPEYGHRLSSDPKFLGNKALLPETFRGGDLVAMYQGRRLGLMGDFYVNRVNRLINRAGDAYANSGPSLYLGVDATADAQVTPWLRLGAGYSFIRSAKNNVPASDHSLVDRGQINEVPRHTIRYSLRLDPPALKGLTLSLWGRFTGVTRNREVIFQPPGDTIFTDLPAVFLLDGCALYNWRNLTFQLLVTNVFDTYYERGGTVPRPLARNGLMFEGSLAAHF